MGICLIIMCLYSLKQKKSEKLSYYTFLISTFSKDIDIRRIDIDQIEIASRKYIHITIIYLLIKSEDTKLKHKNNALFG